MVSGKKSRSQSQWLHSCVLICAIALIPLGLVSAQDYKAVEKRLVDAVSHGELSLEQAGIMMNALRNAGVAKKEAMVKSGELIKKKAAAKMSQIKKEAAK